LATPQANGTLAAATLVIAASIRMETEKT